MSTAEDEKVKTNQLKAGSLLSYFQMGLGVIIGLVYTPVMIRQLGQSEYGLYNTVASTVSMLSILSLGFNAGYVRYYAKYRKLDDTNSIYRLNGIYLIVFTVIGAIGLTCGLFLSANLQIVFKDGLTSEEYILAEKLMILLSINLAFSFPMSVFSTIISANERFVFLKIVGMIKTVLSPLVNLPLLLLGVRSVGLVVSSLVFHLITDCLFIYYVFCKLHNRFVFSGFERGLFRGIFTYTIFIAINSIVDMINTNIDRLLLGRFNGTTEVAFYAVGATLYQHYKSISTAISGVFTPKIHRIYNTIDIPTDRDQVLSKLFIKVGRIQCLILMLITSAMVFYGKNFILLWAGKGYEKSYFVTIMIMIPATVPLIQNLGIEIQRAANKHRFRSILYGIMAICNLILTIILCPRYGAIGAMIGTAISLVLANGIMMNIYYYKAINLDIKSFWKSIIKMLLGMIPAILLGLVIKQLFPKGGVLSFGISILLYTIIYCIDVWYLSMNHFEKKLVKSFIGRIVKLKKI